jgi:hypothetical protein
MWSDQVKTVISSVVAMLAWTPAFAQFTTTNRPAAEMPYVLDCGILELWPAQRDDDPVYRILITPGFNEAKDGEKAALETLAVAHNTVFGKVFLRSDQYTNDYMAQTPGKLEVTWRGSWKRRPSVKMVGRMWNDSTSGRWFYSEFQEENGQTRMKMLAGCHLPLPID